MPRGPKTNPETPSSKGFPAPRRMLILHPEHDSHGKKDVTYAFRPEAKKFAQYWQTHGWIPTIHTFDNRHGGAERRQAVENTIWATPHPVDAVAFFCHGYTRGLQTGHTIRTLDTLASIIAMKTSGAPIVALYACSAAGTPLKGADAIGGDGGFADKLRDVLSAKYMKEGHVDAHKTVGHTTKNPHLRRFAMDGETEGRGGEWLVEPGSASWRKFRAALKGDLRFRFPMMTLEEIRAEVSV